MLENIGNINIIQTAIIVTTLVISVVGHEIAHGWIAYKFGDLTAKNLGRLSPNPLRHIDPLGTMIVPTLMYLSTGVTFGWAKPVPVMMTKVVQNGGWLAAIGVALAGIGYNLMLFLASFLLVKFAPIELLDGIGIEFIFTFMMINFILALFNLYPIAPLDGSKTLEYTLRIFRLNTLANMLESTQKYGFIIIAVIIISPLKEYFFAPLRYAIDVVKFMI
ncbi:MAG: site-2 protease family protein [Campylobacter sp.]